MLTALCGVLLLLLGYFGILVFSSIDHHGNLEQYITEQCFESCVDDSIYAMYGFALHY